MKILFIGMGSIGKRNLASCRRVRPGYEYAAFRSKATGAEAVAGLREFTSWSEVEVFNPDGVWICNPTALHVEYLEKVSKLTDRVFCEKPLSHQVEDLDSVLRLHREKKFNFSYGCILRHHPLIVRTREMIRSKNLGEPVKYSIRCGSDLRTWRSPDYRKTYSAKKNLGGGVSLDLIHEFDYAEYFFGPMKLTGGFKSQVGNLEIETDDYCVAETLHESVGVRGLIELDYLRTSTKREFEIQLANGLIVGNLVTGELISYSGAAPSLEEKRENHSIIREKLDDLQAESVFSSFEGKLDSFWDLDEIVDLNRQVISLPFVERGKK